MEPVTSNSQISQVEFRRISPIQSAPTEELSNDFFQVQRQTEALNAALISQLPDGLRQDVIGVFTNINQLGLQAAEIDQTFQAREGLQNEATDELQALRTAIDILSQDDLQLFAAVIQNQLPDLFSNGSSSANEDLLSDLSFLTPSETILDSLFQVDLRTDQGILSALDLSGSIIDAFSLSIPGSSFLESFLDDVLDVSFNLTVVESILAAEETSTSSGDEGDEIDTVPIEENPPLNPPDSDPPTIIELAG